MRLRLLAAATVAGALALTSAACGSGSGSDSNTVKVAYQRSTNSGSRVMDNYLAGVKKQFEKANPGKKIQLIPIQATENDYYTKLDLMMRSPRTAPDVVYEDTFLINSDIKSGYLRPIDSYLKNWSDWSQYYDTAKKAASASDGKTYGVPDGTDTRGIWYNKNVFAKAGLPADWQPKSWDDLLAAARAIKEKVPSVTPMYLDTGKANGEATSMQGFEMLLYGTNDQLYNAQEKKWVVGSQGFKDSLKFTNTVFGGGLSLKPSAAIDPNVGTNIYTQLFPTDKIGFVIDGSWNSSNWISSGPKPWPAWSKTMGWTAMPTETGQAPGKVSLSGGWTWALTSKGKNPDLSFKFIQTLQNKANATKYAIVGQQVAVRKDVAADPSYSNATPSTKFFTDLVQYTYYRPALPVYPKISTAIQDAMETVTTSSSASSVDQAQKTYDQAVKDAVGSDTTTSSGSKK
jgi:multiple sugar transport system substrate-binding protein